MATSTQDLIAIVDFVSDLHRRGVSLAAENGTLRATATKGVIGPTLAAQIRSRKEDIIRYLNENESSSIAPVKRSAPLPLGFVQQRMWVHNQLEPDTVLYNLPAAWRFTDQLDLEAFSLAFNAVLARHEVLRVSIRGDGGEPTQTFVSRRDGRLKIEDLSSLSATDKENALVARLHALRDERIDLETGLPFRVALIRLAHDEHVFFFMPHHVVWDGWSFDIFLRDLDELYSVAIAKRAASLPKLPIQYVDYAVWHRRWLQSGALESQVAYWSKVLEGEIPPLDLPTDFPRPRLFTHRGDWEEFSISPSTVQRIAHLAAARHGTSFMVILAVWFAFLHRISGQHDIVVGAPIQARQSPEVTDLIGCFVNTLCLRQRVDPEATFGQLIDEVRNMCLGAYEHQDTPVDMLVEKLVRQRDPSRTPLFQAMFSHQQVSRRPHRIGPLVVSQVHVNPAATPTDLMLAVMEGSAGARGVIHFSTELFLPSTIRRMRLQFEHFLEAAIANPSVCVYALPVVTPDERNTLLTWNLTASHIPDDSTVCGVFSRQNWRTKTEPAVSFSGRTYIYAELEARANRLAHLLRARGIGRGALVGLCLDRSADMLAAQLAVLKSGAAYVPLDPAYPKGRLAYMAEDADLALLVTDSSLVDALQWPRDNSILLDADAAALAAQPDEPLGLDRERDARPEDPAYVIYTSGSTGKPKGVVVPHRAVVNFLASMAREPGLNSTDRLVAVTTLSFDIAVLELLLPLSIGAQVVLASRADVADGHSLRKLVESTHATVMQATPATWRLLIDVGWEGGKDFKALVGGEGLPKELAQELVKRTGELWNMYGPTETTVWSTCWKVTQPENGISIGRPIGNTTVWVLDERQQLCPIGVPGEVYIGGNGVALGYLNRPDLTAERFIPDPYSQSPGARLYRTGDRGRWLANGTLEHHGRLDFQVKVRGFRIELGEIEAALADHPDVRQAAVHLWTAKADDVRIVACCVPVKAGALAPISLRKHMRTRLPEYMIPQHFLALNEIPLTPNGKVDRRKLPTPVVGESRVGQHEAPEGPVEATIAEIWTKLINPARPIGRTDKFFEMGGHSLLGLKVLLQIENKLGVRLDVRVLFESLADIAARCRPQRAAPGRG